MSMRRILHITAVLLVLLALVGCAAPTPTPVPPTAVPTAVPPTDVPPTEVPPTDVPPTEVPAATEVPATVVPTIVAPTEAPVEEAAAGANELILATTTSTENSGLLAYIIPDFEAKAGVTVNVIAVGTGQALKLGEDGNADVLLVHARALEDAFMEAGHGSRREDVMYNDFVIVGPESDPAGIMGMKKAGKAFGKIAEAQADFVSRGDESGTHTKEKAIWADAGIEPSGDWYISAGQGMGAVLTMADEQQAYTLTDRATYLARTLEGTDLVILVEGDPVLFNPYGVIAVNGDKGAHIKTELANEFIDWLVSMDTQGLIAEFGVAEFGSPLFTPDSTAWREALTMADSSVQPAALKINGLVANEMSWSEDELKAMEITEAQTENSKGEVDTYTGVLFSTLLDLVEPTAEATTLVLVADDGYSVEVAIEDVVANGCIVAFRTNGGLRSAMPGMGGATNVKGLIEIQVK